MVKNMRCGFIHFDTDNFFVIVNGQVSEFLSMPTSIATQLFFLESSNVNEFPLIFCRGETDKYPVSVTMFSRF